MGGTNDILNESRLLSSSNENSSYLYENLDTVNGLSETRNKGTAITSNANNTSHSELLLTGSKQMTSSNPSFSPSPLADDLRNLSLDYFENSSSDLP